MPALVMMMTTKVMIMIRMMMTLITKGSVIEDASVGDDDEYHKDYDDYGYCTKGGVI